MQIYFTYLSVSINNNYNSQRIVVSAQREKNEFLQFSYDQFKWQNCLCVFMRIKANYMRMRMPDLNCYVQSGSSSISHFIIFNDCILFIETIGFDGEKSFGFVPSMPSSYVCSSVSSRNCVQTSVVHSPFALKLNL